MDDKWNRQAFGVFHKIITSSISKIRLPGDFPGGPVVKNLPSNAGDTGSILGRGTKIPHAAGATKPVRSRALVPQLERSPRTATKDPTCRN